MDTDPLLSLLLKLFMRPKSSLIFILFSQVLAYSPVAAQQSKNDSLLKMRDNMAEQAALRYPVLRMVTVQMETGGDVHYTSKLYGKNFLSGENQSKSRVQVTFRHPVYTFGRQQISIAADYVFQETGLKNTVNQIPQVSIGDGTYNLQNLALEITYRRMDSLFNKPIVWGGTLFTDFSLQSSFARATGLLFGIVPLKTTGTTRISAGLAVLYDPVSITPVLPTFSYWHKFARSPWEISLDIPTHAYLRRTVFSKGLFSIGTELIENRLLRKVDWHTMQGGFAFRDIDLKNGFTLEYPIFRKLLIGCGGGLLYMMQYRVQDPGKGNNDYAIRIKRNPTTYFNINISLLL
jgi:hypothetical protein